MTNVEAPQQQLIAGESVVRRPARALLGWVSRQEAVNMLLGRSTAPNEDTAEVASVADRYAAVVASRLPYQPVDPRVADDRFTKALAEVAARPAVRANFHNFAWHTALVDLTKVLSFQKIIFADGTAHEGYMSDPSSLMEICLPSDQPAPPLGAIGDPDGKGFTISSLNSNLRIAGGQLSEAMVAPGPDQPAVRMQAVTLLVYMGTSYLQVIRYRDRCFLRDGYHRTANLIRAGITTVPCVFIEAKSFEEFQIPSGMFSYETLYSDHPPSLMDFWDDSVSADVKQLATRKVIRIRGEELAVPR